MKQTLNHSIISSFQEKILTWYAEHKRNLPWREIPFDASLQQRDPYKILVSEIMAQQTQLSRVIPKYEAWIEHFPTVKDLADAPTRDLLLYWSGLGYNRRALNLQKAAKMIHESRIMNHESEGSWPRTYEELIKLPGIGKYTANAILCFAFNEDVAVVDTNVRKVIIIEVLKETKGTEESISEKVLEDIANQLLPKGKAYDWNQALMDYAAAMLKDKKITIPRQSSFKTSDRYYRGQLLKILVRQHTVTKAEVWQYFTVHNPVEKNRFDAILEKLEKDGLIQLDKDEIQIV